MGAAVDPLADKKINSVLQGLGNYTKANVDKFVESRPDMNYIRNIKRYGGVLSVNDLNSHLKTPYGKDQIKGLKPGEYVWDNGKKKWVEYEYKPEQPNPKPSPSVANPKPKTEMLVTSGSTKGSSRTASSPTPKQAATTSRPNVSVTVPAKPSKATPVAEKVAKKGGVSAGKISLGILGTGALLYGGKKMLDKKRRSDKEL